MQEAFDDIIALYPQWQCVCEKVWNIGNLLNQNTNNFGAAGFIFNDLNRLLQMNLQVNTDENPKQTLIEFLVESLGFFKLELVEIAKLKHVVTEAGKQILEEVAGIIDADSKKVERMRTLLEEMNITEAMKNPARSDLENISLQTCDQQTAIKHLNETKQAVFSYLVVKNMSISEFFLYVAEICTIIDNALEGPVSICILMYFNNSWGFLEAFR